MKMPSSPFLNVTDIVLINLNKIIKSSVPKPLSLYSQSVLLCEIVFASLPFLTNKIIVLIIQGVF